MSAQHTHTCVCVPKRAQQQQKEMGQREQPHCLHLYEEVDSVLLQMKSFGYGDRKLPIGLLHYTSARASCQHPRVLE